MTTPNRTFLPAEPKPDDQENKDLAQILQGLRLLRQQGGWGSVTVSFKGGDLDEITTSIRDKPKVRPAPS